MKAGVDPVEVNPKADPPICKILDFGKPPSGSLDLDGRSHRLDPSVRARACVYDVPRRDRYRRISKCAVGAGHAGSFVRAIAPGGTLRVRFPDGKQDVRIKILSRANIITVGEQEPEAEFPRMG